MRTKRVTFGGRALPALLLAPQLAVTVVFFLWPAAQALWQSLLRADPFGLRRDVVGLANFRALFADPTYSEAVLRTLVFAFAVAASALLLGLLLALAADRVVRGAFGYRTLLVWPYAVAPAIGAVLWFFLLDPTLGPLGRALRSVGVDWNHVVSDTQAMILIVVASTWRQISYNFLFFLAGLQAIPPALLEAAAIDSASPVRRLFTIVLPLLARTAFFLVVVNLVYAFFDTFGVIHATTSGGPGQATTTLVYKVYKDGFGGLDLGGSAAQSVVLLLIVVGLTMLQFRLVERRRVRV